MARTALYNRQRAIYSLLLATRTNGTVNGTGVDSAQFSNFAKSAHVVAVTGTITDGSHALKLQDSDDGSVWADVAAAFLVGTQPTITAPDDDKVFEWGYTGARRFLRVVATTTGATTGGLFGAVIIQGNPRRLPIARS